MSKTNTDRRSRRDPEGASFREIGRRLDALRDLTEPSPDEKTEMYRLWVLWAHLQPTPTLRRARRHGTPARLPEE